MPFDIHVNDPGNAGIWKMSDTGGVTQLTTGSPAYGSKSGHRRRVTLDFSPAAITRHSMPRCASALVQRRSRLMLGKMARWVSSGSADYARAGEYTSLVYRYTKMPGHPQRQSVQHQYAATLTGYAYLASSVTGNIFGLNATV